MANLKSNRSLDRRDEYVLLVVASLIPLLTLGSLSF